MASSIQGDTWASTGNLGPMSKGLVNNRQHTGVPPNYSKRGTAHHMTGSVPMESFDETSDRYMDVRIGPLGDQM